MDPHRTAFGRLLKHPDELTRAQRIDVARELAGRLQASSDVADVWLGECIARGLREGGAFATAFDIATPPGSRATPAAVLRRERIDVLLLRLSSECGGDARAARVLAGATDCPTAALAIVAELGVLRSPTSRRAFTRARGASRPTRGDGARQHREHCIDRALLP